MIKKISALGTGKFWRKGGDIVYEFTCPPVETVILERSKCFKDIPVMTQDKKMMFVQEHTRLRGGNF